MRILIVSQMFTPEPRPPKGIAFAKALAARGHQVQVLSGFPNYPVGKVYPGYRQKPWMRETMDGIEIIRVPLFPSHDRSAKRRALTYLSWAFTASLFGPWITRRPDVIYAYHGPGTVGIPAYVLSLKHRAPFTLDIQDLWPDTLTGSGMAKQGRAVKLVGRYMAWLYRKVRRILVLSHGFKRVLGERGVSPDRIDVIYNWAPATSLVEAEPDRELAEKHGLANTFNVMFAGNMGVIQALEKVVEGFALIANELPDVRLVLIGSGSERDKLEKLVESGKAPNVVLLPRVGVEQMPPVLALAKVMLVHLRTEFPSEVTIPSKTQEALALGKPLLMAVKGEASEIVERAQAGRIAEPLNPESIADAIRSLRAMSPDELAAMGARGKRFYQENMSFDLVVDQIEGFLERALGRTTPS